MWRHRRRSITTFVAALVALVAACGGESFEGTWRLASFEAAGEPFAFDGPLFLDVTGEGFQAETTCNRLEGEFGGEMSSTLMRCPESADGERHMTAALADGPVEVDGRLVFVGGDVTLIYEPFTEPEPEQLVPVLADERRTVGESALPSASVTGSVPPDYAALVPMGSPTPDLDLFVGSFDDGVCVVVVAAESRVGTSCSSARDLAFETTAVRLPADDPAGVRVALIPDRFAQPAARSDLGTFDGNLLVIAEDVPVGDHVLTNSADETLRLEIVDPPIDPPPTTVTDTVTDTEADTDD